MDGYCNIQNSIIYIYIFFRKIILRNLAKGGHKGRANSNNLNASVVFYIRVSAVLLPSSFH